MDKSIQIVNENLRQVIHGIREHLESSNRHLSNIEKEMNEKVNLAQRYKETVVESKEKINKFEDEITSLEKDLDDLNKKFGGTDFKEILSAGNKEINSKIIEKRAVIQRESQKILDLTNKARNLKEELINLKEKKRLLEKDIRSTTIVEKYYSAKVNEIIDYTEAGNDLELYVDNTPQAELMSNNDYQREFVEVSKVLNDHVFEEIDDITTSEPDEALVEKALKNVVNNTYENKNVEINDIKDALIKDAKEEVKEEVVEEKVEPVVEETPVQETQVQVPPVETTPVQESVTPVAEETIPYEEEPLVVAEPIKDGIEEKTFQAITTEDLTKKEIVEVTPVEETVTEPVVEETTEPTSIIDEIEENIDMDSPFNETPIDTESNDETEETTEAISDDEKHLNDLISKTLNNMNYPSFNTESIDLNLLEDDLTEEKAGDMLLPGEDDYTPDSSTSNIELDLEDDNDSKNDNKTNFDDEDLAMLGINLHELKYGDQEHLLNHANYNELKKVISVFNKHNVSVDKAYSNVKVLTDVHPDTIDAILTLVETNNKPLDKVIPELDKIDLAKLQESMDINKDKDIIDIIIPSLKEVNDEIKDKLNMTNEEYDTLKSNVSEETLKKLNVLSENVVENYSVLNNLGIDNAKECLTKYPTNLMLDVDDFKKLLDKYDQDDLVRCINKNAKVFDKI